MTDNLAKRKVYAARSSGKACVGQSGKHQAMASDNSLRQDVARRLRALQRVAGATEQQMADYLGISRSAWSNATRESGKGINKPSEEAMVRLCERSRVTMDWIYRGDWHMMPEGLANALRVELGEELEAIPARVQLQGLPTLT